MAHTCAEAEVDAAAAIINAVCKEPEIYEKETKEALEEVPDLFSIRQLDDGVFFINCGGDPAKAYKRYRRKVLFHKLMKEILKPRELNLVGYYLGFDRRIKKA